MVSEPASGKRRRRRPRRGGPDGSSAADTSHASTTDGAAAAPSPGRPAGDAGSGAKRRKRSNAAKPDAAERALRDLVGAGPSQLGIEGALRARDVNRPTEQDLAEAQRDVVLVRRHWKPQ